MRSTETTRWRFSSQSNDGVRSDSPPCNRLNLSLIPPSGRATFIPYWRFGWGSLSIRQCRMSVGNLSRISWEFVIGRTVDVHGEGVANCERVKHGSVFTLPRRYRIGLWHFAARARRRALHLGTSGPRVSHYGISARP